MVGYPGRADRMCQLVERQMCIVAEWLAARHEREGLQAIRIICRLNNPDEGV